MDQLEKFEKYFRFGVDKVFRKVEFEEKYKKLVNDFQIAKESSFRTNPKEVIALCQELGHKVKYSKATAYYESSNEDGLICTAGFDIFANGVESGSNFKLKKEKQLIGAAPWGLYYDLLSNQSNGSRLHLPVFGNKHELKNLLRRYYELYIDLKNELVSYAKSDDFQEQLNSTPTVASMSGLQK